MQQRFCSCGTGVWVRYFFANLRWLTFFYHGSEGEMGTDTCPNCGRSLNIEQLR